MAEDAASDEVRTPPLTFDNDKFNIAVKFTKDKPDELCLGIEFQPPPETSGSDVEPTPELQNMKRHLVGVALPVIASFIYSCSDVLIKKVETGSVALTPFVGLVIYLIAQIPVSKSGLPAIGGWQCARLMILQGVLGVTGLECYYYGLQNMALGEAVVLVSTSSGMGVILAWVVLKERPGATELGSVVVMLLGVVLIARPPFIFGRDIDIDQSSLYPNRVMATVICFAGAVVRSIMTITMRKIATSNFTAFVACLNFGLGMVIGGFLFEYVLQRYIQVPVCGLERVLLVSFGVLVTLAIYLEAASFAIEPAAVVSVLKTTEVLFSFIFQCFLFGETTNIMLSLLGGGVIILSSIAISVKVGLYSANRLLCKYC